MSVPNAIKSDSTTFPNANHIHNQATLYTKNKYT